MIGLSCGEGEQGTYARTHMHGYKLILFKDTFFFFFLNTNSPLFPDKRSEIWAPNGSGENGEQSYILSY